MKKLFCFLLLLTCLFAYPRIDGLFRADALQPPPDPIGTSSVDDLITFLKDEDVAARIAFENESEYVFTEEHPILLKYDFLCFEDTQKSADAWTTAKSIYRWTEKKEALLIPVSSEFNYWYSSWGNPLQFVIVHRDMPMTVTVEFHSNENRPDTDYITNYYEKW